MTIFLSSHLLSEIEQTATTMAIINQGKLVVQGRVADLLASGENIVRIETPMAEAAVNLITSSRFAASVTRRGTVVECVMPRERVAELNRALVNADIPVSALVPKRSLEEYFLSITEGASEL